MSIKSHQIKTLAMLAIALCVSTVTMADDPKAREIMEKVDARDDGDNQVSNMEMVLIDKRGNERVRKIKSYTKDFGKDRYRMMFFQEPADVKNTGFLTYDYDDGNKDDDQWLYLPALHKSKRIATSDKSGSFMGSDFTYSDMTDPDLEDYDYTLKKEMKVGNHDVWVIESVPRTEAVIEETGSEKSLLLVRKDNYVVIRLVNWIKKGKKLKYMDITDLALIDGIWTTKEIEMTTKKGKTTLHKTIMRFSDIKYNQPLDGNVFTIRRLEKGL